MDYRAEIDGLRAVAVVPVILFHAGLESFSGGYVGVDVFFVISGYLITTIILREMEAGEFSLVNFYERRARRILPALFLVVLCCLPFAWSSLTPSEMTSFAQNVAGVATFSSNIMFWLESGYFDTASELKPLLHTWSLAVEEQYYILFPLFLLVVWRFGMKVVVGICLFAFVLSLSLAQWGALNNPSASFFLLPTRGWELLLGAFCAIYLSTYRAPSSMVTNQVVSVSGLLLIVLAVFTFDKSTPTPSVYTLLPTAGTALLILYGQAGTLARQLLSAAPLVGLGMISYSAYLWHQPLFAFARHGSIDSLGGTALAILTAVTIGLAYLSWRFVEAPFRNKQRISRKQIFLFGVFGSLTFIAFGLVGHLTNGHFFRTYDDTYKLIEYASGQNGKNEQCWDLITQTKDLSNTCVLGRQDASKSFALVGDSHAGMLAEELGVAAHEANIAGYDYSYKSCPPLATGVSNEQNETQIVCDGVRRDFFTRLDNDDLPRTIVLLARWAILMEQGRFDNQEGGKESGAKAQWFAPEHVELGYTEALKRSYADSIKRMLSAGYKVVLIYPVAEMGWHVPRRLNNIYKTNKRLVAADASTSHDVFVERTKRAYQALDAIGEHPYLVRIKPEQIFCDTSLSGRCIAHKDRIPLYYDDDHLSNAGAKLVAKEIMKNILN